jgi:nucleotide-binding universal stress UspA family protein
VFAKILVPLDGTSEAMAALTPAQTVATATGAVVCLLTAIDSDASGTEHSRTTADLELVARDLRHQSLRVDTCVRRGDPSAEIIVAAAELRAGLIVMTTHGRGGLARALLGSVSDTVPTASLMSGLGYPVVPG